MYRSLLCNGLYDYYIQKIEKLLKDIRSSCMGFDLPFNSVLPAHMKDLPDKEKAQQLAQQLSFALANVSDCTQDQINSAYHWFYEIFYFLMNRCVDKDHVFNSLFKIYEVDIETRKTMFHDCKENAAFLCSETTAPVPVSVLELAVLHLIVVNKQTSNLGASVEKLQDIINSNTI